MVARYQFVDLCDAVGNINDSIANNVACELRAILAAKVA